MFQDTANKHILGLMRNEFGICPTILRLNHPHCSRVVCHIQNSQSNSSQRNYVRRDHVNLVLAHSTPTLVSRQICENTDAITGWTPWKAHAHRSPENLWFGWRNLSVSECTHTQKRNNQCMHTQIHVSSTFENAVT